MNVKDFQNKKTYRLSNNVENPKPDKRVTGDWRKKVIIPEGKLFFFRVRNPKSTFGCDQLEPMDGYSTQSLTMHDPLLLAMTPYLDLIDDTLETILKRYDITDADVLRFLIKVNHTSLGFLDGFGQDVRNMVDTEIDQTVECGGMPILRIKE